MNEQSHIVSGIYTSRAEAGGGRDRLLEKGLPRELMNIVEAAPATGNGKMAEDDGVLKDVLIDGAVGAAVGTGIGVLAEVALIAANVTLFVASPLIAPLAMLGWGASLGGLVGAAVGADVPEGKKDGRFSDLVLDAIRSGHVVLVAHPRTATEVLMVRGVIGDSLIQSPGDGGE